MSPPSDLGEPSLSLSDPGGELQIWKLASHVVLTRVTGHFPVGFTDPIMAAVDEVADRHPKVAIACHEWTTVSTFEGRTPARMTPWSVKVFRKMQRVIIGVSSPFTRAAVRSVNLAVGGRFEVFEDADAVYEAARAAAATPAG